MSWLEVFTGAPEIRPACPASENFAGRVKSVDGVGLSSNVQHVQHENKQEKVFEEAPVQDEPSSLPASTAEGFATFCSSYWRGCRTCPDRLFGQLRFCGRYNRATGEAAEVLQ